MTWKELYNQLESDESASIPMLFGFGGLILYALNGAKLENVELSVEKSVIPDGALHKNKHDDFGLDTTNKGIPVVTIKDDSVETLEEILELKDSLVLHAEVESEEVIFNFELTQFLELNRRKYHETEDPMILLEVGKRLTKELIENTDDNTNLIKKLDE